MTPGKKGRARLEEERVGRPAPVAWPKKGERGVTGRRAMKAVLLTIPAFRRRFEQRDSALRDLAAAGAEAAALAGRAAAAEAALDRARAEAEALGGTLGDTRAAAARDLASLQARLGTAEARFGSAEARLATAEACLGTVERERDGLRAELETLAAAQRQLAAWDRLSALAPRGLFVVGHARSGTTILTEALNASPDIFLLGEANLHMAGTSPGFVARYNAMHAEFGNPRSKTTYCPPLAGPDASAPECLEALARHYRYVGEKVAFRSVALGYRPDSFFDFQARVFLRAQYVCVVRHPAAVLRSSAAMFRPTDLADYAQSWVETLLHVLEICRTFPSVSLLVHERISATTFEALGERLGIPLRASFQLYDPALLAAPPDPQRELAGKPFLRDLVEAYARCRDIFSAETLRASLELDLLRLQRHVRSLALRMDQGGAPSLQLAE